MMVAGVYLLVLLGGLASAEIVQKKHNGYFVDWNGSPRLHEYKGYPEGATLETYDFGNGTREVKVTKAPAEIPGTTSVNFIVADTYDDDYGIPEWIDPNYYLDGSIGYNGQRMGKWSKNAAKAGAMAEPFWNGQKRSGTFIGSGYGYDEYPDRVTHYEEDMPNNGWRRVTIDKHSYYSVFWTVEETFGHVTNGAVPDWAWDESFPWNDLGFRGEMVGWKRGRGSHSNQKIIRYSCCQPAKPLQRKRIVIEHLDVNVKPPPRPISRQNARIPEHLNVNRRDPPPSIPRHKDKHRRTPQS